MASEREFELLDDYLANRMDDQSRAAFEQKINLDQQLKTEGQLQQQMISGIKQARIAQLKGMLNNIPVPAAHTTGVAVGAKVAAWVTVAGLIATGVYLYVDKDKESLPAAVENVQPVDKTETIEKPSNESPSNTEAHEDSPVVSSQESASEQKPVAPPKPGKKAQPSTETNKKLEVYDPSKELEESESQPTGSTENTGATELPAIAVDIDADNKKYNFHYQFKNSKLILYGPFEKGLYEIMEFFNDDKRTLFLFFNDQYYLLKDNSTSLKPLTPIQDVELLNKLKEYRNR